METIFVCKRGGKKEDKERENSEKTKKRNNLPNVKERVFLFGNCYDANNDRESHKNGTKENESVGWR